MSKQRLMVFVCQGKSCRKAWARLTDAAPRRWLKRVAEEAGLPCRLRVVETACQDRCDDAANLCAVLGGCAGQLRQVRGAEDTARVQTLLRACAERFGLPVGE